MSMAGYAGTPAEDMTGTTAPPAAPITRQPTDDLEPSSRKTGVLSPDEKKDWWKQCEETGIHIETIKEIVESVRGLPGTAGISRGEADNVLGRLKDAAGVS